MTLRVFVALLLAASIGFADTASTKPATKATTQAAKKVAVPSKPTSRPAADAGKTFPSAREMAARLLAKKQQTDELFRIAYLNLNEPLSEKPASFALFENSTLTLQSVLGRLHQARDDKDVRAILITLGATDFNLSQAVEIRAALSEFRKAGKRVFVYSDAYDTAAYIAASGATDICMLPGGEIMMPGVGLESMFYKGALDKIGVKADYIQIGQYKGAEEPYTREGPSEELKGEMNKIVDALFEQIVDGISYSRDISKNDVKDIINGVFVNGKVAKERKLVDHLIDDDGLRELLKKEMGRDINLMHDYGLVEREHPDFSNPFGFLTSMMKPPVESDKPAIGLIYLEGVIVDGEGGMGLFGDSSQIGSEDLRKALRMAVRDENVRAIVLRIDSPGGSAMASEVIWQAVRRAAEKKPVIVSIGGMAASGGYYVASAGEKIYADPTAIVGSIGVVGGKFVYKELFDKIGLHTESFKRGTNAGLFSSDEPFSESQRRLVTNWMKQTYEQFTERVMSQHGKKIKDIDEVAHGRIFLAKQGKALGMVDELSGLETALAYAAERVKLAPGSYEVKVIPGTKTLADLLRGNDPEARLPFKPQITVDPLSILKTMSPSMRKMIEQQVQILQLLQEKPVMLVSPYVVRVK